MSIPKVFESEYRFCLILWDHEPIKSRDLAQLCEEQLGWKVTTTYTVIKRLSERGVIKNENTIVSSLVSKEQIQTAEIEELVEKKFAGSIPAFLTAFTKSQQLTADEIQEMQQMLNELVEKIEVYNAERIDGEWVQRLRIHYNCVGEMNIPNEPALPIPAVTVNTRKGVFVSYTTDDRPAV